MKQCAITRFVSNVVGIGLLALASLPMHLSAQTTTTIAASGSAENYTLTSSVSGQVTNSKLPTGSITFEDTSNGNLSLGAASLGSPVFTQEFTQMPSHATDTGPMNTVVADFNNDGKADIAVMSMGYLEVFLGNGDGTFTSGQTLSFIGTYASAAGGMAVGDFNGDGKLDLVVTCDTGICVFLGNGDGTFRSSSVQTGTSAIRYLTVGDFNGDGHLDVAVTAASSDDMVFIYLGNGDGTFTYKSSLPGPPCSSIYGCSQIAAGDFNKDGKLDLIVGDGGEGVSCLLGNGDGTFQSSSSIALASIGAWSSVVGDLNGDGNPDVVSLFDNGGTYGVDILLGKGNGTFTESQLTVGTTTNAATSVTITDLNGDGKPDIVVVGATSSNIVLTVFLGNGDGTFQVATPYSLTGSSASGLAVGTIGNSLGLFTSDNSSGLERVILSKTTVTETAILAGVSVPGGGTHNVDAVFPGSADYTASTSGTVPLTGSPIGTSLSLVASPSANTYGQEVTLQASLNPSSYGSLGTNGESISFANNGSSIGSANLSSGVATFFTTTLPVGTNHLTASYGGDMNFLASSGSATVTTASAISPTVTEISSSVNPTTYGQSTVFTALVDTGGHAPTGTVKFTSNGSNIGSGAVSTVTATNLLSYSQQWTGSTWGNYCGSDMSNMTVNTTDLAAPDGTNTATKFTLPSAPLICGSGKTWGEIDGIPSGLVAGDTYTVSVWLRGAKGGEQIHFGLNDPLSTTVTLTTSWQRYSGTFPSVSSSNLAEGRGFQVLDNTDGNATYYVWGPQTELSSTAGPYVATQSSSASGNGGVATLTTGALPAGNDSIVASYVGDVSDSASTSSSLAQTVNKATPTISISCSPASLAYGSATTNCTAHTSGGGGPVTLYWNGYANTWGSGSFDGSGNFTRNGFNWQPVSSYNVIASSSGDSNYNGTTGTATMTITPAATTTAVSASPNPSTQGQAVNVTCTVAYGSGTPTGTVNFYDGGTLETNATLSSGSAVWSTSNLSVGSHNLSCSFAAQGNFAASSSSTVAQTVNPASTTTLLSPSASPSAYGSSVTFTATVTPSSTGTVTFFDGANAIGSGSLSGSTATFSTTSLTLGSHAITARYGGDSGHFASTSAVLLQVVSAGAVEFSPAIITTVAGNGTAGAGGDGGPATSAQLNGSFTTAVDSSGNLYISDQVNNKIRFVSASTGQMTTFAGTGTVGYTGDGGAATSAQINAPRGLSVDAEGNVYFTDFGNNVVRKIAAGTGIISTVAGNGTAGYSGDGGPATSAEFNQPSDVVVDPYGNLIITDYLNSCIREVKASTGVVTTVAGQCGTAGFSGDGGAATSALLSNPKGAAVDAAGNLYIGDTTNCRIRKVSASTGIITTFAGSSSCGAAGDGGPATSAQLNQPALVRLDAAGNLYIADQANSLIRMVAAGTNVISTVVGNGTTGYSGDGGAATSAEINNPKGITVTPSGVMYVTDRGNNVVREVGPQGIVSFASQSFGTTSAAESVVVQNVGNATLAFNTPTVTGDFAIASGNTCGTGTLAAGATCTFSLTFTPTTTGTRTGTVVLSDNGITTSQTINLTGTALAASSSITLSSSASPAAYGATPTITATVTGPSSGTISFKIDGMAVGTGSISGGVATITVPAMLTAGSHTVTATFAGNADYSASSASFTQVTQKGTATLSVNGAPNPSIYYGNVVMTVTVTGSGAVPTGTVTLTDGGTTLGTITLDSSGKGSYSTSTLTTGAHSITATYSGDSNYN